MARQSTVYNSASITDPDEIQSFRVLSGAPTLRYTPLRAETDLKAAPDNDRVRQPLPVRAPKLPCRMLRTNVCFECRGKS